MNQIITKLKSKLQKEGQLTFDIRVVPNKMQTKFVEIMSDEKIKINVAAIPEKGKANKEIQSYLSKIFGVTKGQIVVQGTRSKDKKIKIRGYKS